MTLKIFLKPNFRQILFVFPKAEFTLFLQAAFPQLHYAGTLPKAAAAAAPADAVMSVIYGTQQRVSAAAPNKILK